MRKLIVVTAEWNYRWPRSVGTREEGEVSPSAALAHFRDFLARALRAALVSWVTNTMVRAILRATAALLCVTAGAAKESRWPRALQTSRLADAASTRLAASSGSITLTNELKLDDQGVRTRILPFTASWSTPVKNGRLTVLGDTSRGKESFAREIRLSGVVSKTTDGSLSYDVSRRFRSGFAPPLSEPTQPPCPGFLSAAAQRPP